MDTSVPFTIKVSNIQFSGPKDNWPNILDQVPNDVSLFPHQVDAVKWLYERECGILPAPGGNILGDVMGLGKTITTTTLISLNPLNRTLIICSKSLVCQWVRELLSQNHTVYFLEPAFARTVGLHKDKVVFGKDKLKHGKLKYPYVAITTYGKVKPFPLPDHAFEKADSAYDCAATGSNCDKALVPFRKITWSRIVVDEVHSLRNGVSLSGDKSARLRNKSLKYCRILRLKHRSTVKLLGLTGTPLQNRIGDLASVFLFLGLHVSRMTDEEDLARYMKTNMFRRNVSNLHPKTKELIKFPTEPYNETRVIVEYDTDEERNFYIAAAGRLEERLRETLGQYKDVKSEDNILVLLTLLRLLSSHPAAFVKAYNNRYKKNKIPDWRGNVSKLRMVEKQLRAYHRAGESCIVFVHFYEEAERIYNLDTGYKNIEFLNGSISFEDRDYVVQNSKKVISNGGTFLILANIIACGEGLNLQHFSNVIIASPDYNPSAEEQAIARVYRIGSTRKVNVTRYYHKEITNAIGTLNIDAFMKKTQDGKKKKAEMLIDSTPNAAWEYQITTIPGYDVPSTVFRPVTSGEIYFKKTRKKKVKRNRQMITHNKIFVVVGDNFLYNCLRLPPDMLSAIANGSSGESEAVQVNAILLDPAFWTERERLASLRDIK